MKLNKETVRSIYNVYQDCGSDHVKYNEGMAVLHDIFKLFGDDKEIDIVKSKSGNELGIPPHMRMLEDE